MLPQQLARDPLAGMWASIDVTPDSPASHTSSAVVTSTPDRPHATPEPSRPAAEASMHELRVFAPEPGASDDSPEHLLSWFDRVMRADMVARGTTRDTIDECRRYLRQFCEWWLRDRMYYPDVLGVTREAIRDWRDGMLADGRGSLSVNKHLDGLRRVLTHAHREGEIAAVPPFPQRLRATTVATKRYVRFLTRRELALPVDQAAELDGLSRLYQACSVATWPQASQGQRNGVRLGEVLDPVQQWRAAIVLACTYGFRLGDLITFKPKHDPLTWDRILPVGKGPMSCRHEPGWLFVHPLKTRRHGKEFWLPLTVPASEHLRALPRLGERERVFAWPSNDKFLYSTWESILSAAGLDSSLRPCHLRKTAHTWWEHYFGREIADEITGHAPKGVGGRHYTNAELALAEAALQLPTPRAWQQQSRNSQQQQKTLFEL